MDKYKMKEIKTYVANELFKCQKKTNQLYQDFTHFKQLKQEMSSIAK
jgi:hypothetical protein